MHIGQGRDDFNVSMHEDPARFVTREVYVVRYVATSVVSSTEGTYIGSGYIWPRGCSNGYRCDRVYSIPQKAVVSQSNTMVIVTLLAYQFLHE